MPAISCSSQGQQNVLFVYLCGMHPALGSSQCYREEPSLDIKSYDAIHPPLTCVKKMRGELNITVVVRAMISSSWSKLTYHNFSAFYNPWMKQFISQAVCIELDVQHLVGVVSSPGPPDFFFQCLRISGSCSYYSVLVAVSCIQ